MIEQLFKDYKLMISEELNLILTKRTKGVSAVFWSKEVSEKLLKFSLGGKMFRGGLTLLAHKVFGGKKDKDAVKAACAVELLQSGLLIHDDIIDQDLVRRGDKTIFAEYGQDLGICFGDAVYFLAYEILPPELLEVFSRKSTEVVMGQMQDIYLGSSEKQVDEKDVLDVYVYKTASYTCSLPLMMGAMLAGVSRSDILKMEELGKALGIIFQIKDDEIGIFGEEEEIGKSIGGDIKEGKKTLYYYHLFRLARGKDVGRLKQIFGNKEISAGDISFVREKILALGVDTEVKKSLSYFEAKARKLIGKEKVFLELLEMSLKREK